MNLTTMTDESRLVLYALGNPKHSQGHRTVTGIAEETGLDNDAVVVALQANRKLIEHNFQENWYKLDPNQNTAELRRLLGYYFLTRLGENDTPPVLATGILPPPAADVESSEDSADSDEPVVIILNKTDKAILHCLIDPRFPRGRRSAQKIATELDFSPEDVELSLQNRLRPIVQCGGRDRVWYSLNTSIPGIDFLKWVLMLDALIHDSELPLAIGGRHTERAATIEASEDFADDTDADESGYVDEDDEHDGS